MMSRNEPNLKNYERERIILEYIQNNPNLHHNGLLKIIVPKYMAKTTFEKCRDSLVEKEILSVENNGNMKFYLLTPNYMEKSQQYLEQNTNKTYHDLKLKIKKLNVDFSHKDVDEKILLGIMILKNLLETNNGFTILDSIKNSKKTLYRDEHLVIQQLISQLFKIIKKDVDHELIFPIIVSYHQVNVPHYVSEI
jgi:hypothetical protein